MDDYSFLDYNLPGGRIAQRPIGKGDARAKSKLLHAQIKDSKLAITDYCYSDLPKILRAGDVLVLNNTKVIPCRFFIQPDNNSEIEILLVHPHSTPIAAGVWEALARPMKRLKEGKVYQVSENLSIRVIGRTADSNRLLLEIASKDGRAITEEALMPIPPYIRGGHADDDDLETYQTSYAKVPGSIAAPTAGLHFSPKLLNQLEEAGVICCYLTLHVGSASFTPIRDCDVKSHQMTSEFYEIAKTSAEEIWRAKRDGRRIVVVGTTSLRALESAALTAEYRFWNGPADDLSIIEFPSGLIRATDLFIKPGFQFRVCDVLITNFHQPRSTHLLLVAAFMGVEPIKEIYSYALNTNYRFLSYGDGMILFPGSNQ